MVNACKPFDYDDSAMISKNGVQMERSAVKSGKKLSRDCQKCINDILVWNPKYRPDIFQVLTMKWLQT
jgi:hypothetical protein